MMRTASSVTYTCHDEGVESKAGETSQGRFALRAGRMFSLLFLPISIRRAIESLEIKH
jgi:hypothetical protein